jgi:dipeptidase E
LVDESAAMFGQQDDRPRGVGAMLAFCAMRMMLTSAGLTNDTLRETLREIAGTPLDQLRIAVVPTAANVIPGDKGWLINDYLNFQKSGFAQVDIVDVSALERTAWQPRLTEAHVLAVTGGDTTHLLTWMRRSGLTDVLPDLMTDRIYVGISAGSMVTGPHLGLSQSAKTQPQDDEGLHLVDFLVQPHLNSPSFPLADEHALEEASAQFSETIYGLDDDTAVLVDNDRLSVVGEGTHRLFPGNRSRP